MYPGGFGWKHIPKTIEDVTGTEHAGGLYASTDALADQDTHPFSIDLRSSFSSLITEQSPTQSFEMQLVRLISIAAILSGVTTAPVPGDSSAVGVFARQTTGDLIRKYVDHEVEKRQSTDKAFPEEYLDYEVEKRQSTDKAFPEEYLDYEVEKRQSTDKAFPEEYLDYEVEKRQSTDKAFPEEYLDYEVEKK